MSPESWRVVACYSVVYESAVINWTRLFLLCAILSRSYQTFCVLSQALFLTSKPRLHAVVTIYPSAISAFHDPQLDADGRHAGQHKQRGIQSLEGTLT